MTIAITKSSKETRSHYGSSVVLQRLVHVFVSAIFYVFAHYRAIRLRNVKCSMLLGLTPLRRDQWVLLSRSVCVCVCVCVFHPCTWPEDYIS